MYAFSHQGFFDDLRCARELISLHKTSFLPRVLPDFQGLFDDLRCAPELISIHKLLFSRHVFPDFCACGTHGLPCGCSPRPRGTKAPKTTLCWFPALLPILLFEVLLFRFLMTQSPLTLLLSSFFSFFCLRHNHSLPYGVFPPPQGHKSRPKEVDACLFHIS